MVGFQTGPVQYMLKRPIGCLDDQKKRDIVLKNRPLDGWMDELQTGPVGYILKRGIG